MLFTILHDIIVIAIYYNSGINCKCQKTFYFKILESLFKGLQTDIPYLPYRDLWSFC